MSSNIARAGFAALALSLALVCNASAQGSDLGGQGAEAARAPRPLPPLVSFSRSNSGWSANFSFADPVVEIQWSLSENGPYESTGFLLVYDPLTRRPMANSSVELETEAPFIYVRYADLQGNWVGPFTVRFEPTAEIERSHQRILETTAGAWLSFRSSAPNILYYTHIASYRSALREFRVGLDKAVPDQVVALAPCNMRAPGANPSNVDTHLWIDPKVEFASAQVVYRDGTVSKVRIYRR